MNNMNYTIMGAILGILLFLLIIYAGWLTLWTIPFALIGAAVGAHFDGRVDLTKIFTSGKGQG